MTPQAETNRFSAGVWISENTAFEQIKLRLFEQPSTGIAAWARTTTGIVSFLIFLQILTGILMAFQYVPTAENAFTTIAYIEQAAAAGTWIRSLHYHSSILLPIAVLAHLAQMIFRRSYGHNLAGWAFGLIILGLVLAAGATGYALPWDVRAFDGVNIALSLAGNVPLIGGFLREWMQNGSQISTLTLSRFYGLHVFIVPFLILFSIVARIFLIGPQKRISDAAGYNQWLSGQLVRNSIVIGLLFLGLALFSLKFAAPFGPAGQSAADFLPRPGPQFLWLFEMQKYTDGALASTLALGFPGFVLGGLLILPVILKRKRFTTKSIQLAVSAVFVLGIIPVGALTALAVYQDMADPRISKHLAEQEKVEAESRSKTFKPQIIGLGKRNAPEEASVLPDAVANTNQSRVEIPGSYKENCAKCHGNNGQGTKEFPELAGVTQREEDKLSDENLLDIINDPKAYGLSAKMPSFRDKLTADEKLEIINYIKSLN